MDGVDTPRFGYGLGGRPLYTTGERGAEMIRKALRKAHFRDVNDRHTSGFTVEDTDLGCDGCQPLL